MERLERLIKLVTTEPSSNMEQATGVPPHCMVLKQTATIMSNIKQLLHTFNANTFAIAVAEAVRQIDEDDAVRRGVISVTVLEAQMNSMKSSIKDSIESALSSCGSTFPQRQSQPMHLHDERNLNEFSRFPNKLMQKHGRNGSPLYDTPDQFFMPSTQVNLRQAFQYWVAGDPANHVRPYRQFNSNSFGPTVKQLQSASRNSIIYEKHYPDDYDRYKFNTAALAQIKSVMSVMELGITDVDVSSHTLSEQELDNAFKQGVEYLKTNCIEYAFKLNGRQGRPNQYSYTTFAQRIKPASIKLSGTPSDLQNLAKRIENVASFNIEILTEEELCDLESLREGTRPLIRKRARKRARKR
jgi:hypothetical protein